MCIFNVFLVFYCINLISGFPTDDIHSGFKPLTPEERKRLDEWTEDSKENIWELSGQFEGDIILSPEQRDEILSSGKLESDGASSPEQKNGKVDLKYRWPSTSIPYDFNGDFTEEQKAHIRKTLNRFTKRTCIEFRPVEEDDDDWILVTGDGTSGCSSFVGRQGGKQILNLEPNIIGKGCFSPGSILHEFIHALGFHHMQSDSERDNYIEVITKNIKLGKQSNFRKYNASTVTNFEQKYDYHSILHYSAYAFSRNGKKTIITTDKPDAVIGQRRVLSPTDVKKINIMYDCEDFLSNVNK